MNLNEDLREGITACGFEKPTEVQKRAICACIRGLDTIMQSGQGITFDVLISTGSPKFIGIYSV